MIKKNYISQGGGQMGVPSRTALLGEAGASAFSQKGKTDIGFRICTQ